MATVVLVGSLDTKGREYAFVRNQLVQQGIRPLVIDFGVLHDPEWSPDVTAAEVARAAGVELEMLRTRRDQPGQRAEALSIMERGAARIVLELWHTGRCDAVLGFGGGQGSTVISAAMRALPIGVPKLLVSTMTPTNIGLYFGVRDLCLMYAVTDIAGINRVSRLILSNAARAAAGMAIGHAEKALAVDASRPLVGLTMFGTTTEGVLRVQARLEEAGFETVVFHAVGSGGRALEDFVGEGLIDGVVDYTPSEITDERYGGIFTAGPDRLEAAARRGIPQVVVPGALGQLTLGPKTTVPDRLLGPDRRWIVHNPSVTVVRADAVECAVLGALLAEKVNAADPDTAAVVLPLGGLSEYETPPGPLADTVADQALFDAIRSTLDPRVRLIERQEHINDPRFADVVADCFINLWSARHPCLPAASSTQEVHSDA